MILEYEALSPQISLQVDGIVSIHYFEYTGSFRYHGEKHDFWELVFCDKGPIIITADDREMLLNAGEFYIHPPSQFHNIRTDGTHSASTVILSFTGNIPMLHTAADRIMQADSYLREALFAILREARLCFRNRLGQIHDAKLLRKESGVAFGAEQVILRELELLLIHLIRGEHSSAAHGAALGRSVSDRLSPILQYMEENTRERLTVESICRTFSLSPTTLKKLFSASLGCGAMSYFLDCRIREAKKLIREEELNFSAIAAELRFASVHHFSRIFKQKTDMTPTEYARSVKALLEAATPASRADFKAD